MTVNDNVVFNLATPTERTRLGRARTAGQR